MEIANIMLDVGSDGTTIVSKSHVTPAEVAVLRLIHGNDAVSEIEVLEGEATENGKARTHRQEIARLTEVYGKNDPEGGKSAPAVARLFPGAAARVFETFEELELDESLFKAETRAVARPATKPAAPKDENDLSAKSIADLKTLADAENVDLQGATKKADIITKIEEARIAAADAADADNDFEDMDKGVFD